MFFFQEPLIMELSSTRLALAASLSSSRLERVKWSADGTMVSLNCLSDSAPNWCAHRITLTVLAVSFNLLRTFSLLVLSHWTFQQVTQESSHQMPPSRSMLNSWKLNKQYTSHRINKTSFFKLTHFFLAVGISSRVSLLVCESMCLQLPSSLQIFHTELNFE